MLLPVNFQPEKSLYYYGSLIIKELKKNNKINVFYLYEKMTKLTQVSIFSYTLTLDWLYLIDVAIVDKEGMVKLCISEN